MTLLMMLSTVIIGILILVILVIYVYLPPLFIKGSFKDNVKIRLKRLDSLIRHKSIWGTIFQNINFRHRQTGSNT